MPSKEFGIWFPTIRCGTGADVFTERLCAGLNAQGIRAEICWLPLRAEYAPWTVALPTPPSWVTLAHVNSWLPTRFVPKKLPYIVTVHHCVHDKKYKTFKSFLQDVYHRCWIYRTEAECLRRARCVVAVSDYTSRITRHAFGISDIRVIYNGVNIHRFYPQHRLAPHRPFRLLYVGNWTARKGVDVLGPILRRLGSAFELYYTEDRHGKHRQYALPPNCYNIGRPSIQDLISAYQNSDALIFPTRLEGFGLVVVEAMACGLPTIVTRCSALPEIVEHGVSGWLCENTVDAFVDACRKMAEPSVWCRMRREARRRVELVFDECRMIWNYIRLYESVL